MKSRSIIIQSVLYQNDFFSLIRSLRSIQSALLSYQQGPLGFNDCAVCYGDASKEPLLLPEHIDHINDEFSGAFKFEYRFFNKNVGFAKGHNLLAEHCTTDYLLIINPDIILAQDFFSAIMKPYELDDELVGIVEGRQIPVEHPKAYDDVTGETSWASGACLVTPTQVFKQLQGFDSDTFFMYCEDVDYSWRVRALGKKVIYQPQAPVFHPKKMTNKGEWIATEAEKYYSAEAALMMAYKWSQDERWKELLSAFKKNADENLQKAAKVFSERLMGRSLPEQIDRTHEVSTFMDDLYTEHRF